ncbi:MAG: 4-hydroxybenzoate octaprenyltransferase [Gammaproteobacteria bacterium]|nr:MAG: 4-hydroxybenzoate octaprenyltransferase [Gammaproteobacteria bacterium]
MIQHIKKPPIDINRLVLYAKLVRLDKPIGILLLLWPTLWALFIAADGIPNLAILVVFILGVILMRSAGCAINDYADRDIDPFVARTKQRPVASGLIQPKEALVVAGVLAFIAFVLALIFLNKLTIFFALGAALLAATYPFMKRLHFLPQVHLGIAFAVAIPMAFTAITNAYPTPIAWLLFTAAVIWTTAYDTQYAMVDREEDIKIGVKSTAILFGPMDKAAIGMMQFLVVLCLVLVGINTNMSWIYYLGIALAGLFFIYQQVLIKHRFPDRCFYAFLNNNYFGMVVFIGIFAHYWVSK